MEKTRNQPNSCTIILVFIRIIFLMKIKNSKLVSGFLGFDPSDILWKLLSQSLNPSLQRFGEVNCFDSFSSEYEENFLNEFSDFDSSDSEAFTNCTSDEEDKLITLVKLGYTEQEASLALDRCGSDPSLADLIDFLAAAQAAKAADGEYPLEEKFVEREKVHEIREGEDVETVSLPNPMVGFGLPNEIPCDIRIISNDARGPPYFYYENVALAPKGVWATISRFLYDIAPEFVDSKFFCAATRKRGYIHNLPITNRFPLLPQPPQTIHEALPLTKRWWPKWDARTKLNCLQTCVGTAKLTNRVRKALEAFNDGVEPPLSVQKYVLGECFFFSFQSQDLGTYVLNKQIRNRQFGCLPQRGNDSSLFIPSVLCFPLYTCSNTRHL
ncbi:hypothetical protein UlMin_040041 [Ulmus minor]